MSLATGFLKHFLEIALVNLDRGRVMNVFGLVYFKKQKESEWKLV